MSISSLLTMLASVIVAPPWRQAKVNKMQIQIFEQVCMWLLGLKCDGLPITDRDILKLQVIIDVATLMDQFQYTQKLQT